MRGSLRTAAAFVALTVMATPAVAQGQGQGAGMGRGARMQGGQVRNPAAVVLEHRDDLDLTAEQVERLEELKAALETENAPRIERLRAAGSAEEMRQVRDEIRATNRGAGLAIHEILTDAQEQRLRPIMHQGRPGWGGDRPAGGRGGVAAHRGARAGGGAHGMRGGPGGRGAGMGAAGMGQGRALAQRNPAEAVLAHREALALTDAQVERLTAIRERVERENEPRLERLRTAVEEVREEMAGMTAEERRAARDQARDRMAGVRTIREEIRATNRAAGDEIHELLTDEQEALLPSLMRQGRGMGMGRGTGTGTGTGTGMGMGTGTGTGTGPMRR